MNTTKEYTGTRQEKQSEALSDVMNWLGIVRYNSTKDYLVNCLLRSQSLGGMLHVTRFTLGSIKMLAGVTGYPLRAFLHECVECTRHIKRGIRNV